MLAKLSQDSNTQLRSVAHKLIDLGKLPGPATD